MTATAETHSLEIASLEQVREHFPALSRRHAGHPVAYFDGPGGTQVPRSVADAMTDYLLHHNANTHWRYPTSEETDAMIAGARAALADLLGATPGEIAFGANMTTLTFHLGRALGRGWHSGDEIVITELDHHANVAPWRALERERGVTIRTVPVVTATGELDWAALERALSGRDPSARHRGGIQRAWHDQRRSAGLRAGAGGGCAHVRRRCALRRRMHWSMSGRSAAISWPARPTSSTARTLAFSTDGESGSKRWTCRSSPRARHSAGTPGDGHAQSRGHRRRRSGGRVPGLARHADRTAARVSARACGALHDRGQMLLERLWVGLSDLAGVTLLRAAAGPATHADRRLHRRGSHQRRGRVGACGGGRLRLQRRFLCDDGRRAAGSERAGSRPGGVRVLYDERGGRSADRGRPCIGWLTQPHAGVRALPAPAKGSAPRARRGPARGPRRRHRPDS